MAKIGKYELVRKLASGGMAEVFLAKFEWAYGLEKTVVVKRILQHMATDPNFIDYMIPTAGNMPKMHVAFADSYEPSGPFGAKGLGEIGKADQ